jgi:hypothetical protein
MAITYTEYPATDTNTNGVKTSFTYSFPVLQGADVKVSLNGTTQATTKYTVYTASNPRIVFNNTSVDSSVQTSTGAPKSGVRVRIFRQTTVGKSDGNNDPKAFFASGSSIRAVDLNANHEQSLYAIHEIQDQYNKIDTDSLDVRYYTESELDGGQLDNRYYTETELNGGSLDGRYYTETELNSGSLDGRYFTETELTSGGLLDTRYYTETELNNGSLDTRYYTETELDAGQLDNRYYTETQLDGGALDARYYTKAQFNAGVTGYYTQNQLDNGSLDSRYFTETELTSTGSLDTRYYTETELDGGQLDNRYFTETELNNGSLDSRYYTETELTGGQLDSRYYTKTEVDNIGLSSTRNTVSTEGVALTAGSSGNTKISNANGANTYVLLSINNIDYPCWIRVYTSEAARSADVNRNELTDPTPGSGVLAEVITSSTNSNQSFYFTPAIFGFTVGGSSSTSNEIYLRITDKRSTGSTVSHQPSLEITRLAV